MMLRKQKLNNMLILKKLPKSWKLFLFYVCVFANGSLFIYSLKNNLNLFLLVMLNLFYYLFQRKSLSKILNMLMMSFFIFLINVFAVNGRVVLKIFFLSITKDSIDLAINRGLILFLLFMISTSIIYDNRYYLIIKSTNKSKVFSLSVKYFFHLLDTVNTRRDFINNMKTEIKTIILNDNEFEIDKNTDNVIKLFIFTIIVTTFFLSKYLVYKFFYFG